VPDGDLQYYGVAFHLANQFPGTDIGQRMVDDRIQVIIRRLPVRKTVG